MLNACTLYNRASTNSAQKETCKKARISRYSRKTSESTLLASLLPSSLCVCRFQTRLVPTKIWWAFITVVSKKETALHLTVRKIRVFFSPRCVLPCLWRTPSALTCNRCLWTHIWFSFNLAKHMSIDYSIREFGFHVQCLYAIESARINPVRT